MNESVDNGAAVDQGGLEPVSQPTNDPQPVELKDDGLYTIPGQSKPVKWGEYYKGLQGSLTKASQRASKMEQEIASYKQREQEWQRQQEAAQRAAHLRQVEAGRGTQASMLEKLRALSYLSGEEAAYVVESLQKDFGGFQSAIQQRDQVLVAMAQALSETRNQLQTLMQGHNQSSFDSKISGALKGLNLHEDPDAIELAKEIYLSREGDDLDEEFPGLFKQRWDALQAAFARRAKQAAEAARNKPFVPGRGGIGNPSRGLQLRGSSSPEEVANAFWPGEPSQT